MTPELMGRLICAKFLFNHGAELLARLTPYASALALLSFQDAVEIYGSGQARTYRKPASARGGLR